MVEILADLFKQSSGEEIDKVVYLTQGRVAPLFEPLEFGMAEKMVLKALSVAFGQPLEKVTAEFKKSGDLGETAQGFRQDRRLADSGQTITEVFNKLLEIAKSSGEGSVEKKIYSLAEILKNSDPLSARYLARIPIDKMRLGFSDMTVLEGLSWMVDGTKKNKDEIESAYNVRPDLGFIAAQVKSQKVKIKVEPAVGIPILVMRAERLKDAADIVEKMGGRAAVEPKIDGLRTQLHFSRIRPMAGPAVRQPAPTASSHNCGTPGARAGARLASPANFEIKLFSRGLENVTAMYPDLVKAAIEELDGDEIILDGEAIAFDPKTGKFLQFQETVTRKRKYDIVEKTQSAPLKLIAFDVLYYNGKSMLNEPYASRRKLLEEITKNGKIIIANKMDVVDGPKKLKELFDEDIKKGLEGIMAKKLDGVYQAGARGWNWIKLKSSYEGKLSDTIDAVVMGYDFGQGKRNSFGVGAFLIGVYDQKSDSYKTISKVGTGLTDEEWRQLVASGQELVVSEKPKNYDVNKVMNCDVWLKPKLVGVFRADQITKSPMHTAGFALRFPRLDYWRTDKQPEDATSLKEIEKMSKLQKS